MVVCCQWWRVAWIAGCSSRGGRRDYGDVGFGWAQEKRNGRWGEGGRGMRGRTRWVCRRAIGGSGGIVSCALSLRVIVGVVRISLPC